MFRHLIEVHQTSRDADDTVLWQIADLAKRRLRQVHGLRYADDPARATELLGSVSSPTWSRATDGTATGPAGGTAATPVAELGELVRRIERL